MIWLDAVDPIPKSGQQPKKGAPRGTCSAANYPNDSGNPDILRKAHPHWFSLEPGLPCRKGSDPTGTYKDGCQLCWSDPDLQK